MSLKSKIEAVIYASEEPVTLQQLVGLLAGEAQSELEEIAANQASLPLNGEEPGQDADAEERVIVEAGTYESPEEAASEGDGEASVEGEDVADTEDESAADAGDEAAPEGDEAAPVDGEAVSEDEGTAPEAVSDEHVETLQAGTEGEAAELTAEAEVSDSEEPKGAEESSEVAAQDALESGDPEAVRELTPEEEKKFQRDRERNVRDHIRRTVDVLIREYAESDRGIEIREVASGFRMGTKPEYHDAVRGFVKSLKPALKLTLPALETLAVVAYKQPVTAAEISEIRGVDSAGVLGGLMSRKLIATAGRKQVIGRPMLYKTTRDFLLRFGLKDVNELPSMEEFERMAGELVEQEDLPMEGAEGVIEQANARGDAEHIRAMSEGTAEETSDEDAEAEAAVYAEGVEAAEEPEAVIEIEEEIERATAESAAGGNDEEVNEESGETGEELAEAAEAATEPEASDEPGTEHAGEEESGAEAEEPQTAG